MSSATLERVYSEAAVLPQDFEDTVHATLWTLLCVFRQFWNPPFFFS